MKPGRNSLIRADVALTLALVWLNCGPLVSGRDARAREPAIAERNALDALALPGVLISADQATAADLEAYRAVGYGSVTLLLTATEGPRAIEETTAARAILEAGFPLFYWVEIGRCPELADRHPEWMASLQGHPEWRRLFPDAPRAGEGEVIKVYPWTPILYEEVFEAQRGRVERLLKGRPTGRGIFLNDLQGAPSACGCGNALCRWTADYGPVRTARPSGDDAAARFVAAVKQIAPERIVIPVWTTECEEHDGAVDGACAGVGCFQGICWRAYARQLRPVADGSPLLGVMATYRELERDLPIYGQPAGWIHAALKSFEAMPPIRDGQAVPVSRLVAVLQGWDVSDEDVAHQIEQVRRAGAAGYLVARVRIEQNWSPRLYRTRTP